MTKVDGMPHLLSGQQSYTPHNEEKSCNSSLISYSPVPPSP